MVLYEIKSLNKIENRKFFWTPKITYSTKMIYNEAIHMGFDVRMAIVWLYDDWDYDIEIEEFKQVRCCVDMPKKYDKKI